MNMVNIGTNIEYSLGAKSNIVSRVTAKNTRFKLK